MLRETRFLYSRLGALADAALCVGAFFAAHWLRNAVLARAGLLAPSAMEYYQPLLFLFPPLAVACWFSNGAYRVERLFNRPAMARALAVGTVEAVAALALIAFFFLAPQTNPYTGAIVRGSRAQIVLFPLLAGVAVWGRVEAARWWLERRRRRGHAARNVLIAGSGENLRRFLADVMAHPLWGFRVEGLVSDHESLRAGDRVLGHTVIAGIEGLAECLEKRAVDEVVFVPGKRPLDELAPRLAECQTMGVRARLSLNFFSRRLRGAALDSFDGIPVVTYETTPELSGALLAKWVFDRVAAAVALVALSPALAVIALAIRREGPSGAPVLFRQRRVGQNGRAFTLLKFRTMRPGAEAELERLRAQNETDGPRFKMANDPRVTAVGRALRRHSLDELPQLWNVLRGEMSLIGPRPPLPDEVARYSRAQRRRLSMKPGMTCLWAIRGRDALSWDEWVKADLEYIDHWSLWLDARILCQTLWLALTGKGAS